MSQSIKTMAEFTDVLQNNPDHAYDFISNNYYKFDKDELVNIIKELLLSIKNNCHLQQQEFILNDAAIELDEQYDEVYQEQ